MPQILNPENISGEIVMYRNDDFELSRDNADNFLRKEYTGTLLKLTNKPTPVPPQPQPDIRTASQKRQEAYEKGYVETNGEYKDFHIEWNNQRFTCDELSQLGMRYEFREETLIAAEIRQLVEDKVSEIRMTFPDENME